MKESKKSKPVRVRESNLEPLILDRRRAAELLNRSPAWLRGLEIADRERLANGLPILGPPWAVLNGRICYRVRELRAWLDRNAVDLGQARFFGHPKREPAEASS